MRDEQQDGAHMWLRQSVTVSVDGQSRTLEIGIPLRTGATPDEIEALLAEADAGMERIGRHLDARVAQLGGMTPPASPPATAATAESVPAAPAPSSAAESAPPAMPAARTAAPPVPAPEPASPAPSPAIATPPAHTIAERPAAAPSSPARPAATAPAARASAPADTGAGTPLTLPDFIAAVQAEQGLNPKQVMEKLGVKSLSGLNLREALEMLRRQALRDGVAAEPAPVPAPAPPPAPVSAPATPSPPRYFEEEDDAADITFTEDYEDLDAADEYGAEPADEDDEEELDEVPDFGSPAAEPVAPVAEAPSVTESAPASAAASAAPAPVTSRAARILTHMRGMRGGGAVSAQQRTAFKNIVVAELGEPKAKALIAAIWSVSPEKLGPEQFEALNNWGKRETFADDTELVLAAVEAERVAADHEAQPGAAGAASAAPERAAPTRASSRRVSRAAPAGGA